MISVIVPTFNRGHLVAQTIESILEQSYADFELVIVDDNSLDNTEMIVSDYSKRDLRIVYAKRPESYPKGANSCRNYGFEISKGEFIKWIDSDDLLTHDALGLQLESLESSGADLSICNSEVFYSNPNDTAHRWGNIETEASVSNFLLAKFRWHTGAGMWRKSCFSGKAPWKEGLTNSQEWLMHLSQLIHRINLVRVPQTLCLVRAHQGSMSHKDNKSASYYYNELKARKFAFDLLHANNVELSPLALRKIRRQFFIYHLFTLYKLSIAGFLRGLAFYSALLKYQLGSRL